MAKRAKASVEDLFETLYQNDQIETTVLKTAAEKRIDLTSSCIFPCC